MTRNSGTSYVSVREKCQKLIDAGLLKIKIDYKSRKYYATEEGIKFFAMLVKYEGLQTINNR